MNPVHCTCASFFTVRGKHKEGCPAFEPQVSSWEEEFREFFDKTLKPKNPSMRGLERELIVNFITNLLAKARCEADQAGWERGVVEESKKCFEHEKMARIEELKWVLENCSGGGDWRRKIVSKLGELSKKV